MKPMSGFIVLVLALVLIGLGIYFFAIGIMRTALTVKANHYLALRRPGYGRIGACR